MGAAVARLGAADSSGPALGDQIKRELHQSIVEVGTKICARRVELEHEVGRIRRELSQSAERVGLRIAAAGTHPFSKWKDQVISPGERYENIVEELQQLARSLLIFGLHIHVAVPDHGSTIELLNEARYFLPHLLALSTSSPFWQGRDTGLKSYRTTVFRRFPRSGIPDEFGSWSEYEAYLDMLVELHCIDNGKKIWWDLRPHPLFGTLEFRICDVPTSPARHDRAGGAGAGDRGEAVPAAAQQPRVPRSTRARWSRRTSGARRATASTAG